MNEELVKELGALTEKLEGKTANEVKEAIGTFEEKFKTDFEHKVGEKAKEVAEGEIKVAKESLEKQMQERNDEYKSAREEMQKHIDNLDLKLQEKNSGKKDVPQSVITELKNQITENFEKIKTVRKGNSEKIDFKVVGNMTLGTNLTGDQPRSYSNTVVTVPRQLLNFVDLLGPTINIEGGTYTFPKEIGSEGAIAVQTEGAAKSQIDYDLQMVDVNTDFLAGYTVYSKKMANNLPFLESFLPGALRRDYMKAENSLFSTQLASEALASTEVITGKKEVEMLIGEIARLEALDNPVNGIALRPDAWYTIATTEKSAGAGYGLPGIVTYSNGVLTINGIPIFKANWLAANKYFVGDWSRVRKIVTEGLSLEFSTEDEDNFKKNNITARIEEQNAMVLERDNAIIYGDFIAT